MNVRVRVTDDNIIEGTVDCPVCDEEDAVSYSASYEHDPDVGLFGWGVDITPHEACPLEGIALQNLVNKIGDELEVRRTEPYYDD